MRLFPPERFLATLQAWAEDIINRCSKRKTQTSYKSLSFYLSVRQRSSARQQYINNNVLPLSESIIRHIHKQANWLQVTLVQPRLLVPLGFVSNFHHRRFRLRLCVILYIRLEVLGVLCDRVGI